MHGSSGDGGGHCAWSCGPAEQSLGQDQQGGAVAVPGTAVAGDVASLLAEDAITYQVARQLFSRDHMTTRKLPPLSLRQVLVVVVVVVAVIVVVVVAVVVLVLVPVL